MSVTIEVRHDFASKLRQTGLHTRVAQYVEARQKGTRLPRNWGPSSINLDLTTACNYTCPHCVDMFQLNTKQRYDHEQLKRSLDNMVGRGLRSVIIIGGGEPTLYPKFGDIIAFLKERGVQIAIVSNGSRNEKIAEVAPLLGNKDWIRLSLDAGNDETFQAIHLPRGRRVRSLERICSGVGDIRARNPNVPVGFSFIITWEGAKGPEGQVLVPNIAEVSEATRLARDSGFSYISLKAFLTKDDESEVMDAGAMTDYDRTLRDITAAVAEAKTHETETFRVVESTNLRLLREEKWRAYTKQPAVCHMTAFRLVLSPLGLFNCPANRGKVQARIAGADCFADEERAGSTVEALEAMLASFKATAECAEVTCLYNSANWALERTIAGLDEMEPLPDREDYFL